MANPFSGICWISRGDLHRMVQDSMANEHKERERLRNAQNAFDKRVKGVTDSKKRFLIFKEVAAEFGYREEWFIDKINL